ncbi:hypothetical protein HOE37_05490 [Candidatus Woesearchaeota archaeon]|jgi:hypothetical protein|nr:hypothetical protein [Candidatus Woesearchaeota archaeon]MBT4111285.1 hypothetical protein [Candidatus Woesearchaeota archaeon]MBT4335804.1 hypothetical protein [Candidatus Woesearchaeota archaeon]MBT4469218.1 hypothetical protein [Candidatus Woesearchaeota archaeon]MBT6744383.1 hypothetical protein [Candidatus Woesearchaeota archaeon]
METEPIKQNRTILIIAIVIAVIAIVSLTVSTTITGGTIIKKVSCYDKDDCNDHNEATEDSCKNPATEYSLCINKPVN